MKADAQVIPRSKLLKSGRPLKVPKIEDMCCSTPTTHPYQGGLQDLEGHWRYLRLRTCFVQHLPLILTRGTRKGTDARQSQENHGSSGKSAH